MLRCPECGWCYDPEERAAERHNSDPEYTEMFKEHVPCHHDPNSSLICDGTNRTPESDEPKPKA